jgi:hypothetical protein
MKCGERLTMAILSVVRHSSNASPQFKPFENVQNWQFSTKNHKMTNMQIDKEKVQFANSFD